MNNRTIREAHQWASSLLQDNGIIDGRMVSEWMLQHLLGIDRSQFLLRLNEPLEESVDLSFQNMVQRRLEGEPLQYILGETSFFGLPFKVDPRVLIPRPETETLIEKLIDLAYKKWGKNTPLNVVDVGTGSGAIPITLAKHNSHWNISTIDISLDAIQVATMNAKLNEVNVHFIHGSCLEPVIDQIGYFHIVVSNPPYIRTSDVTALEKQVKDFEPHLALDGGEDGLDFYRQLVEDAYPLLREGGFVIFEIGDDQADDVVQLLQQKGYKNTIALQDLAGKDRIVIGEK